MITNLLKLGAITFMVISSSFLCLPTIAETESENSTDIFSKPIRNEVPESEDGTEAQPATPADIPNESKESKPSQIGDIIEVNPRSEQWENIHTGDLSRGTIMFKFPGK